MVSMIHPNLAIDLKKTAKSTICNELKVQGISSLSKL